MPDPSKPAEGLSYQSAGVDIDAGNELVRRIGPLAARTRRPEVLTGIGGFGAFCAIPPGYREPVLVSSTDGVGTKLRLAIEHDRHRGVGIDLVAMCVNDLLVTGAEPLFFLDYYATGRLDVDRAADLVAGVADGCEQAGCALVGGETAEMPGMYAAGDYDVAGFTVGVVERDGMITGAKVAAGDALIALASSGPHSNGYSLIRKVLEVSGTAPDTPVGGRPLLDALLEPTRIYVQSVRGMMREVPLHAAAHITGGGLPENLPRVLPEGVCAEINTSSWAWPAVFRWLQEQGNVAEKEMLRTFNCGVGMVLVVPSAAAGHAVALLQDAGEQAWCCGRIVTAPEADADRVLFRAS